MSSRSAGSVVRIQYASGCSAKRTVVARSPVDDHAVSTGALGALLRKTWSGERDHVLLSTLYNTGARVSELTALKVSDVDLDRSQSIRVLGKGRKERRIPLWRETARVLQLWLARLPAAADGPAFPNRNVA